jgi:hypothetical protein
MAKYNVLIETGKNTFQVISINASYRSRGKDARTQIKQKEKKRTLKVIASVSIAPPHLNPPKKRTLVIILKNKILPYSAKNTKIYPPPLYSILNPDTNSDSPSAKSKGLRFVYAKQVSPHINLKGKNKKQTQIELQSILKKSKQTYTITEKSIIKTILTS